MSAPTPETAENSDRARTSLEALRTEIAKAVVGQDPAVTGLVVALLCRGHVLLEGVPGVAKTLLVRTLAASLELDTKRVQFTPDLMPSDVTGSLVYDARTAEFSFQPGPVFTNLLLADEINRTPPKTQSSLLEAMEERQVTVDGTPRLLPDPFLVAATQNPVEYEGTYPLPEAQLDRFLLKLTVPLPTREDEINVLTRHAEGFNPRDLQAAGVRPVAGPADLEAARAAVAKTSVSAEIAGYVVDICRATRESPSLTLGVSPRGATALLSTARAWAWLTGRDYVIPGRCEGPGPAHPAPPDPAPARSGDGRSHRRLRHHRDPHPRPRPPLRSCPMALTGRTALLAALGSLPVGILAPSWTGMLAVNAPLSLAILCDYALAAPVRTLRFTRSGDTSVRLGDSAEVQLTVTNPSSRRLRAHLRDAWPPSSWHTGTEQAASRHKLTVPAGERRRLTTVLRPTRRGDRHAERVTVRSYGPLGLAARQGNHQVPWTVRVLPPFTSRKHLPSRLARLRELDGRTSVLIRGQGTEFDSLRDYVPGDDTRSIDWRATARQTTVAVRTWRPERDRHILVVLDTGRTSAGRVGDVPRLDAAMDAALLLTALASRAGDRVDLLAYDRRIRAQVQGRSGGDLLPAAGQRPRSAGTRTRRDRRPRPQRHRAAAAPRAAP